MMTREQLILYFAILGCLLTGIVIALLVTRYRHSHPPHGDIGPLADSIKSMDKAVKSHRAATEESILEDRAQASLDQAATQRAIKEGRAESASGQAAADASTKEDRAQASKDQTATQLAIKENRTQSTKGIEGIRGQLEVDHMTEQMNAEHTREKLNWLKSMVAKWFAVAPREPADRPLAKRPAEPPTEPKDGA